MPVQAAPGEARGQWAGQGSPEHGMHGLYLVTSYTPSGAHDRAAPVTPMPATPDLANNNTHYLQRRKTLSPFTIPASLIYEIIRLCKDLLQCGTCHNIQPGEPLPVT